MGAFALFLFAGVVLAGAGKKKTTTARPRPGQATTGGGTRPGGLPTGRIFKDHPTPGYWYKVKARDLRPLVVKAGVGSTSGVAIDAPDKALAWRAYTLPPTQVRADKDRDLSKWPGLNGILGPRQGVDTAIGLLDEVVGGVVGGVSGNWGSVASEGVAIIQEVWSGIRDRQDAAARIVGDYVFNFSGNMVSAPENRPFMTADPLWGYRLDLKPGDKIYIPDFGDYFPRDASDPATRPKPNRP